MRDYTQCVQPIQLGKYVTEVVNAATYSNLENHPRLIRARQVKATPKIVLDPKTGLPIVDGEKTQKKSSRRHVEPIKEEDEEDLRKCIAFVLFRYSLTRVCSYSRHRR